MFCYFSTVYRVLPEKIIETRTYPLPERLKGIELAFIETPGKKGKFKSRVVAIIKFSDSFEYKTKKEFYADIEKHKVAKNSDWAWKDKSKHGWIIESLEVLDARGLKSVYRTRPF